MKKALVIIYIISAFSFASFAQAPVRDYMFTVETEFASGSVRLSQGERNEMKRLIYEQLGYYLQSLHAQGLSALPSDIGVKSAITISRTDAIGSAAKNLEVSQKRSEGLDNDVRAIMISLGVRFVPSAFFPMGVGEQEANEAECTREVRYCSASETPYQLPWDPPPQPCYKETMVCPSYQRRSTIEIVFEYIPSSGFTPPTDEEVIQKPLPDIVEDQPGSPSIIEIEPPNAQDQQPPSVQEVPPPSAPAPAPALTPPNTGGSDEATDDVEPNTPEAPADTSAPAEEKPGPNKLKVYGNEIED